MLAALAASSTVDDGPGHSHRNSNSDDTGPEHPGVPKRLVLCSKEAGTLFREVFALFLAGSR